MPVAMNATRVEGLADAKVVVEVVELIAVVRRAE